MSATAEYSIGEKSYVKIRYRVRVPDGPFIKGAVEPEVMDFVTSFKQVIPGLEDRLMGHVVSDRLSFTVPPEEAFGPRYDQLVFEQNKADFHFPPGMEPYNGMQISVICGDEGPDVGTIREVKEDTIVIDCNHALSGFPLQYDLEIIEARPARQNEICQEWESECGSSECSGCSPHEIVLGKDDTENS
jgi:FKBP-type peptidyl-prolyl cis-trans isomerase 2